MYLSSELHTRIELQSLYIKPFKSLVLEGLYVQDLQKDTLLYSPRFTVDLDCLSLKNRKISVSSIQLDKGSFYLKDYKDRSTNLDFIINYFSSGTPQKKKKTGKPYDVTFDKLVVNDLSFKYKNYRVDTVINGINFDDVSLRHLSTTLTELDVKNHLMKARVSNLTFRERSGFYLRKLNTLAIIDSNKMEFKNLLLQTQRSHITDYVKLSYKKFKDFGDFIRKVRVTAHLDHSHVSPYDIAFFAPEVKPITLNVEVDGNLSGYVNNIRARNFSIKAGQATYLKGNFDIKGLPRISETFMDLDFDQVFSNRKDAEVIIAGLTASKKQQVPQIIEKFGNVNFKGRFTGFLNDFIAYGEFKTSLGRIVSDVNMKILKTSVYSGTIKVYDFDLGKLANDPSLGRTTALLSLNGKGFEKANLYEEMKSTVTYLEFNKYAYRNLKVDGTFNKNLFKGRINVNDPNLFLDFNGTMDLNPKLPQFNFVATVNHARLNRINLTKDTIAIDASFNTNFTGNNLSNIEGSLQLAKIKLTSPENAYVIDSVNLSAQGTGTSRALSIRSDILDADIKGQYDLNTLPSYFKTVVKKYIPSYQAKTVKPAPQDFDFSLKLKEFEPIALLLAPTLKLPEGATLSGKFVSAEGIATFNAFASQAEYKGIRATNFILDETSAAKALNIFISLDRIDISDSLYIKNINIANVLQNDSLNLNVKLSDKDATNQLDLNGLVKFKKDSAALFSILPSDVIINRDVWKVKEQVQIGFEPGKVSIRDFALSNNEQVVTVNGAISSDPLNHLKIDFKKFRLSTFNPLTKGAAVTLNGTLNGEVNLSTIMKDPRIETELKADSVTMNSTDIGDVVLNAGFDDQTKLVDVAMGIVKDNRETLRITGTYNAKAETDNLDMSVRMINSPLIIFQPFLKHLVSNLTGEVSSELKLTGTAFAPRIDGTVKLENAGMIVNYLKTPYHINQDVSVENSIIHLNDLVIKDNRDHSAVANGTVDMHNPNNPDIDVVIKATDFLALNTKAKDNQSYYGTAYGTGTFSFKGPTDNMVINIDAKTEPGTVFNIPLNSSETISDNNFITFVSKDSTAAPANVNSFKGLVMNFDLAVDQNSEVNIITDLGRLSGRGETESLNLRINREGDFQMLGTYNISSGKFDFTAQEFINKVFQISQGGTIRWTGDPTDATIGLKAIYEVRTSLRPLYTAAGRPLSTDQRVLSQAVMNLTGNLLRPDITFDLDFPTDAYIKDDLQGFLSDANNKNQQALSLIVRRSFSPNTGLNIGTVNSTIASAGTELIFNSFNNILSQSLNLNFVDFNIRSLNEASASLRLLNDRLAFTYGITDRRTELNEYNIIGNSVARDVEANYLIRRDGSLLLRASNRLNNRSFLNPSEEYVSAIGLVYRQEFDNFREFLRTLIGRTRREERRKQGTSPSTNPVALKPDDIEVPKSTRQP